MSNRAIEAVFDECYQNARKMAPLETGLPMDTFPLEPPFAIEQSLDPDYLPN
ncbi:DUF29 family protein [Pseudanabaena sp. PCC 6802]|uniref:DUF29 family protein n=1 Tax=Pseudanabaena sp. PCC 6802 TaxID=118173 RepID=UPI00034DE06F|nr:DUF29 family protein [Pseudanabaena sp. PCC 6802]